MYRPTYIDGAGRKRREMGYFSLNKANQKKVSHPVIVQARDRVSAANKINLKYHMNIKACNLREVPLSTGYMMLVMEL